MATRKPDDGAPMSTNQLWAALTVREKNLVGKSLTSCRSFDIENFFPSAVRLVYDSNPFRETVEPAEVDTQEAEAPHVTPDTTQHQITTAKNDKGQVQPSRSEEPFLTAFPRSEDGVDKKATISSGRPLAQSTISRTADDPDPSIGNSGKAGGHDSMTAAAPVSDINPFTFVQRSVSNGTNTANIFALNSGSMNTPVPKSGFFGMNNDSKTFGTRDPPKPLAEGDTVKYTFGSNKLPAATSPFPPTDTIQKKTGSLFGSTPVSTTNTSQGTTTHGLFGSNSTEVVRPAPTSSSLKTGLFGTSSPAAPVHTAGFLASTSDKASGSGAVSGFGGSSKSQFGGSTSSAVDGSDTGMFGQAKPAAKGLFGQSSVAPNTNQASPETTLQGGSLFSRPPSSEQGTDQSTKSVRDVGLFGNSASRVAPSNPATPLASSSAGSTTRLFANDNVFKTNSECVDDGPNVSVFGAQKRKNDEHDESDETEKKIRKTEVPPPHNPGPVFGHGIGIYWKGAGDVSGGTSAEASELIGQAATRPASSSDITSQQIARPSSSSALDLNPPKSTIATTSQAQAHTKSDSPFLKKACATIESFSKNDPFIRPSSPKTVSDKVEADTEESLKPSEQVSSTGFQFGVMTTETKSSIATTSEDPFLNVRPTILFDTLRSTVNVPTNPEDIPPDSTQDHFVPYRERESNGALNEFQCIFHVGDFTKFSAEEVRLADYNREQRYGSFPNLVKDQPEQAAEEQPAAEPVSGKSTSQSYEISTNSGHCV